MAATSCADRIQTLWDDMADFDAASTDAALDYLLRFLCTELRAQNVSWLACIRMQTLDADDPSQGWRPCAYGYLYPDPRLARRSRTALDRVERGGFDITDIRNVALAGSWRANRLIDLAEPEWFDSAFYREYYLAHGQADAIWAGCPVNADAEIYFGIYRSSCAPRFRAAERDHAVAALRGLKWFYRHLLLSHGLGIAKAHLTDTEREVLRGLLAGQTEKGVARQLEQSPNTTHVHVTSIYRKFGISNRASLMALWLGPTNRRLQGTSA